MVFDVKSWNKVKISDLNKIYREQLTREVYTYNSNYPPPSEFIDII